MKKIIIASLLISSFFWLHSQSAAFTMGEFFGNTQLSANTTKVFSLGTNQNLVAGEFIDQANFGSETYSSAGERDIFLLKMEGSNILWSKQFGGMNDEVLHGMDVDSQGNIYMSLTFSEDINIFGNVFESFGGQDGILVKLSSTGEYLWAKQFGNESTDYLNTVTVNHNDEVIVTGKFYNSIIIEGTELISVGSSDFFMVEYDNNGVLQYVEQGGGSSSDEITGIDVDESNNIFITGYFYGDVIFDGETITSDSPTGIYLTKYDADCNFLWAKLIEGQKTLNQIFPASSNDGNVFVAGNFKGEVDFGNGFTVSTGEFDIDIYYAKYDTNGNILFADSGGGTSSEAVVAVDSDEHGNFYLIGQYLSPTVQFADLSLDYSLC